MKALFVLEEAVGLASYAIGTRSLGTDHFDFFLGAEGCRCQNVVDTDEDDAYSKYFQHLVREGDVFILD